MTKVIMPQTGEMIDERRRSKDKWRIDKNLLGTIIFLFFQTVGLVWVSAGWKSDVNSMLKDHEKRLVTGEAFQSRVDGDGKVIADRLGRLEERSLATQQSMMHIENMMEMDRERRLDSNQRGTR